jgi:SOS regulatory protein LexA
MDNAHLTKKQLEFYRYIVDYKAEHNIWPTYREISERFDFKSPNSVTQNIKALVKKGFLHKVNDDEYVLADELETAVPGELPQDGIPIRGIITAGYLQEAVDADLGAITLNRLFPNLHKMFALRVSGQSMRDAGINDGDFVLLIDSDIQDGDIGAVLYNGETSLKKVYYGPNGLRLEPCNPEYTSIAIEPGIFEEVRIVGRYVGHVNRNGIFKAH